MSVSKPLACELDESLPTARARASGHVMGSGPEQDHDERSEAGDGEPFGEDDEVFRAVCVPLPERVMARSKKIAQNLVVNDL